MKKNKKKNKKNNLKNMFMWCFTTKSSDFTKILKGKIYVF